MLSTLERLRTVGVIAILGIAVCHVFELPDKLEEPAVRYQGILFIALIVGCVLLAALSKRLDGRLWWTGVLAVTAPPLIMFIISRTSGLPGGSDDIGAWKEPTGILSMVFEAVGIIAAARAFPLLSTARQRVFAKPSSQRPRRAELARDYR